MCPFPFQNYVSHSPKMVPSCFIWFDCKVRCQRQIHRQKLSEQAFLLIIFYICHFHFPNRISHFDSFEYDADYLKDSHHHHKKLAEQDFWNIFWSAQSTCITFAFTIAFHTLLCRNIKFVFFVLKCTLTYMI